MSNPHLRAALYAGRPLLLRASDAEALMRRLVATDPRAHERSHGPLAFLRKVGAIGPKKPVAMDDDYGDARPPMTAPHAYAPVWLGGAVEDEGAWGWSLSEGIALLNLDSPLAANGVEFCGSWFHGYDTISAAIDEMIADSRVRGIFIRSDCPGGVVHGGMYALAAKLRSVRAASGGKPIWVYADCAASAAYWLASSCDRIITPRVGLVGSIGCVLTHIDYSAALAKDGISVTSIQFGDYKTDGAEWKPLTETARAHLQAEIDQIGRDFVADVVLGRPQLTAEKVIATQAGCYLGWNDNPAESGVGLGLADEIMEESQAFAALAASVAQAPRRDPAGPSAPPAAATKETKMKRSTVAAILADAALTDTQKLAKVASMTRADSTIVVVEDAEDDEDEELDADGNPIATDPVPPAEDDEKMKQVDPAAAAAILDLPEARGREALARKLAFTPRMTVASAKELLGSAPKASTLSERMKGRDPQIGADGGTAPVGRGSALVADAKARRTAARR